MDPRAVDQRYEVVRRGQDGRPREIRCRAHDGCKWKLAADGPRRDDDPIFLAMFGRHVARRETPGRPVTGHERRRSH